MRAAAETVRPNPDLDTERTILELGVGEALVSFLENKGEPSIVQRTLVRPPNGRIGPLTESERQAVLSRSPVAGKYDTAFDRESAHEILEKRRAEKAKLAAKEAAKAEADQGSWANVIFGRGPRGGRSLGETVAPDVGRANRRRMISTVTRAAMRVLGLRR